MTRKDILFGLMVAVFLAVIIAPFASSSPDGLEKVAEDKGFLHKGEIKPIISSPIPDYAWPGVASEKIATSVAGVFGTLLVFGVSYLAAVLIKRYRHTNGTQLS